MSSVSALGCGTDERPKYGVLIRLVIGCLVLNYSLTSQASTGTDSQKHRSALLL